MATIANKIQLFNAAYKIAWDLAIQNGIKAPDLARRINDAVRVEMKTNVEPAVVGNAAFKSLKSEGRSV